MFLITKAIISDRCKLDEYVALCGYLKDGKPNLTDELTHNYLAISIHHQSSPSSHIKLVTHHPLNDKIKAQPADVNYQQTIYHIGSLK